VSPWTAKYLSLDIKACEAAIQLIQLIVAYSIAVLHVLPINFFKTAGINDVC
jgi:hypothetical protein